LDINYLLGNIERVDTGEIFRFMAVGALPHSYGSATAALPSAFGKVPEGEGEETVKSFI